MVYGINNYADSLYLYNNANKLNYNKGYNANNYLLNPYNNASFGNSFNTFQTTQPQVAQEPQVVQEATEGTVVNKGMSTGAKVGLGTLITAGVAIAADYAFCKGKHVKSLLKPFQSEAKVAEKEVGKLTDDTLKTVEKETTNTAKTTEKATSTKENIINNAQNTINDLKGKIGEEVVDVVPSNITELEECGQKIPVQVKPRTFASHSYTKEDVPKINITSRTTEVDYRNWTIVDGKTHVGGGYQYHEPFKNLRMNEVSDAGKTVLVIGKNSAGEKTVWLQAASGRVDFCSRPIRTSYVLSAPKGQDFTKVQKDLIKGIVGRSQEELAKEMPLARSAKVINPGIHDGKNKENIIFNQDILLNEVNHFATGREFTPDVLTKINDVDKMDSGEYLRLV